MSQDEDFALLLKLHVKLYKRVILYYLCFSFPVLEALYDERKLLEELLTLQRGI